MAKCKDMTREDHLAVQDALLEEYRKPEFQAKLQACILASLDDPKKRELESELRAVREKVGARFGFDSTPEGVRRSSELFLKDFQNDPEIARRCNEMRKLLCPRLQDVKGDQRPTVKENSSPPSLPSMPSSPSEDSSEPCSGSSSPQSPPSETHDELV